MTRLSIVIVSYNAAAHLERCLASLLAAPPAQCEIIVVDNGSTDGSARVVDGYPSVQLFELVENVGFAAGNNLGIRAGRGELVLLLNSDTLVPAGAIDTLVRVLDEQPDVSVVGPRLVDGEGKAEYSFGAMLTPWVEWRRRRLLKALRRGETWARRQVDVATQRAQRVDWVTGACLLVRRRDAQAVGLLDERFFMYTEDVDFCASIRRLGKGVLFTPAAQVVHLGGRSGAAAPAATRAAYRRSHRAFYEKHHPLLTPWLRVWQWLAP